MTRRMFNNALMALWKSKSEFLSQGTNSPPPFHNLRSLVNITCSCPVPSRRKSVLIPFIVAIAPTITTLTITSPAVAVVEVDIVFIHPRQSIRLSFRSYLLQQLQRRISHLIFSLHPLNLITSSDHFDLALLPLQIIITCRVQTQTPSLDLASNSVTGV
jgi:hypothetical protein